MSMNNVSQSTTVSSATAGASCFDANHIDVTTIEDLEAGRFGQMDPLPRLHRRIHRRDGLRSGAVRGRSHRRGHRTWRARLHSPTRGRRRSPARCAAWQRRYGWDVDPTCIRPVPDVLEAFEVFLREIVRAGNSIVVPTPAHMPFLMCAAPVWRGGP